MGNTMLPVRPCPPGIAAGAEASIGTRLAYEEAKADWVARYGPRAVSEKKIVRDLPRPAPKIDGSKEKYTFIGVINHRRPGSYGAAFIDWLIANPGARRQQIKDAGHEIKHLKWDLENNPGLFRVE